MVELYPANLLQQQQKIVYRADRVNQAAMQWLDTVDQNRPWFIYLHYMSPHAPYLPPAPFDSLYDPDFDPALDNFTLVYRFLFGADKVAMPPELEQTYNQRYTLPGLLNHMIALYDGEIRYLDGRLEELFGKLTDAGLMKDTVVVICSDHGEEFADHGGLMHGKTLYGEVTRTPLILYGPGLVPDGDEVKVLVRNLDIAPTVLDLAGLPAPEGMEGASLRPLWEGKIEEKPRVSFARLINDGESFGGDRVNRDLASVTTRQWKLIKDMNTGALSLFDLDEDPGEKHDLAQQNPEQTRAMAQELDQYFARSQKRRGLLKLDQPGQLQMDEKTRQKLKSLGYLGN